MNYTLNPAHPNNMLNPISPLSMCGPVHNACGYYDSDETEAVTIQPVDQPPVEPVPLMIGIIGIAAGLSVLVAGLIRSL